MRNEYMAAENRILRAHLAPRLRLTDPERSTLTEIGKPLGSEALKHLAYIAKPDNPSMEIVNFGTKLKD